MFAFVAVFAPWIAPEDYSKINLEERHRKPLWLDRDEGVGLLGTDGIGRDIASGIVLGSRISMLVGVSVSLLYVVLNIGPGMVAAYYGGWVDDIIMRFSDMNAALPPLVLLLAVMAFLGQGVMNLIIFFGISAALSASRVTRGEVFRAKNMEYVLAARSVGMGDIRIMLRHIMPNIMAPVIVGITLGFGWIILAEASLSYLGFGANPNEPSWGRMLADARDNILFSWAPSIAPGIAIAMVVLAANLFGDWVRDVMDPRLRGRRA
jgi:peptide/nickel transport system permease protein